MCVVDAYLTLVLAVSRILCNSLGSFQNGIVLSKTVVKC